MDIGKAFTFAFDDDDKVMKILVGGLIALIPIVNFAGLGYLVRLVANVRDGEAFPLPAWDDFGEYFMDGLKIVAGLLVYSLPLLFFMCVFVALTAAASEMVNSSEFESVLAILLICFYCVVFIFALIPYVLLPAILARYAETGEMSSIFKLGDLWNFVQQDVGNYVIVILISFVVLSFIAPLGIIACFVGVFFTQSWAYLVTGHLTGQLAASNSAMTVEGI